MDYQRIATGLEIIGLLLTASGLIGENRLINFEQRTRAYLLYIASPRTWKNLLGKVLEIFLAPVANFAMLFDKRPEAVVIFFFVLFVVGGGLLNLVAMFTGGFPITETFFNLSYLLFCICCCLLMLGIAILPPLVVGALRLGFDLFLITISFMPLVPVFLLGLVIALPFFVVTILVLCILYVLWLGLLSPYYLLASVTNRLRLTSTILLIGVLITLTGLAIHLLL